MIKNAKEILERAKNEGYAVPHFNINNLEWIRFILEECELHQSPVILGVSESAAKYMGGFKTVVSLVRNLDDYLNIKVPVVIHLDHGSSVESCQDAITAGFTSVMIDASREILSENIRMTKEVIQYAKEKNVTVEAEIGSIGVANDHLDEGAYAKVEDTVLFYEKTKVDFLAPALGSVHGLYQGEPKLDFERMTEIQKRTNIPLVLHGGTGIPDHLIQKAIACGIQKININTELQIVWSDAVREFLKTNKEFDPRKIIRSGEQAMKQAIRNKIFLFGSDHKA